MNKWKIAIGAVAFGAMAAGSVAVTSAATCTDLTAGVCSGTSPYAAAKTVACNGSTGTASNGAGLYFNSATSSTGAAVWTKNCGT